MEHLDRTPFTDEQLEWLPGAYAAIHGAWHPGESEGVRIKSSPGRFGDAHTLEIDGVDWMCTTPLDVLDHRCVWEHACGDVLLTGLGLGLAVIFSVRNPLVRSVTVLEEDFRVRDLVWPMLAARVDLSRVNLLSVDADVYVPDHEFDFAYIDHTYAEPGNPVRERCRHLAAEVRFWWDECAEVQASWR